MTLRYRWERAPSSLLLDYSLHAAKPMTVRAMRVTAGKAVPEQKLLAPPELAVFDLVHGHQSLLARPGEPRSRPRRA